MSLLSLKAIINASGRMSKLGVSTLSDHVLEGIKFGGQHYFDMDALMVESGKTVAQYVGTEHALITNSASAAIALALAGIIAKDNWQMVEHLYESSSESCRECLIMKGHNVDYGAPIEVMMRLGGAIPKEVGYANSCSIYQMEQAITDKTVGVLFVQSHHCVQKNMPTLVEVYELCQRYQLPLVLDAAAEEDFLMYTAQADLVIFSGSKAIQGPTSGILAGRKKYIDYASAHLQGIGRAMKIGKENIFGLLYALEQYKSNRRTTADQLKELKKLKRLEALQGVRVSMEQDEAGRDIYRGRIHVEAQRANISAKQLVQQLKQGEIAIYTRDYYAASSGFFDIDPRPMQPGDMEYIIDRIKQIVSDS